MCDSPRRWGRQGTTGKHREGDPSAEAGSNGCRGRGFAAQARGDEAEALRTETFADGGAIPDVFTCEGDNISPALTGLGSLRNANLRPNNGLQMRLQEPKPGIIGCCGTSRAAFN